MTRALLAVLLLLIISGGGAALSWQAHSNGANDLQPALAQSGSVATPTFAPEPADPQPSTPEETPVPATLPDLTATATPVPDVPSPTQSVDIPADLPSASNSTPQPTEVPADDPPTPQWSLVQPPRRAPTQIRIPDIGVDAQVVGVAQTDTGAMEAPADYGQVGWYRLGTTPGDPGRAVLVGHVDSKTGPAVFYKLRELVPGSIIEVSLGNGAETLRYVVSGTANYPEHEAPLDRIFGPSENSELVLITCSGDFDFNVGAYPDRLVIYADLAPQ